MQILLPSHIPVCDSSSSTCSLALVCTKQLQEAQEKNLKLQSQLSLVRSRLASEQRKNEQLVSKLQQQQQQQITSEASEYSVDSLVSTEKNKKCPRQTVRMLENLTHLYHVFFTIHSALCSLWT